MEGLGMPARNGSQLSRQAVEGGRPDHGPGAQLQKVASVTEVLLLLQVGL